MSLTTEVVVIGAGPAGSAAAITLARAGREVLVVDKATFPRDKFCGDGLTADALRRLEALGLDPATVASWTPVHDVWLRGPAGHQIHLPLPDDGGLFAVVARRRDLDAAMVEVARAAGAELIEGTACTAVSVRPEGVRVDLSDGRGVAARYLVAADGMWSPVRKALGLSLTGYRGDWHAFRQYFRGVSTRAATELFCWFEPDFLPGYAWAFPSGSGTANVGFGIRRGSRWQVGDMAHLWRDLLRRPHIRQVLGATAEPEGPPRAWPIPARIGRIPLTSGDGRVLFAGDAAAATDPMTGEGIGQALATGTWAARAVIAAGPGDPQRARTHYQERVRRELIADHALSALLVRALQHRRGARFAIRLAGLTPWTRRNFARWLFEDYPRAVVATPSRWSAGMFSGPGAFRSRS